jgi:hypothetical protein
VGDPKKKLESIIFPFELEDVKGALTHMAFEG